jgi:hypothetical protein
VRMSSCGNLEQLLGKRYQFFRWQAAMSLIQSIASVSA